MHEQAVTIIRRVIPECESGLPADLHPVLRRIYRARQITDADHLDYTLKQLQPFDLLTEIDKAVDLLTLALHQQQRVLIVGDFDCDGATSVAVAIRALKKMGLQQVGYLVPNRFEFGYGLTPEIVAIAADQAPDLIITVDNGISSIAGVAAAKKRGIKVLVTDHHLPGNELPDADAIVNPNQQGDVFPCKSLAGVGVVFYLLMALRSRLRKTGWFESQRLDVPNLAELLDLVALGTVADVVPLEQNNRILVAQGLSRIRGGHCCAGIRALIKVAGREQQRIVASDLGFAIGPRLNAAGRIDDMSLGIECLLTDDDDQAFRLAGQLDALNRERRVIEADMKAQALAELELLQLDSTATMAVGLCLFDASWHQGVTGILASRLKERWYRPVIVFADAGQQDNAGEELIKGSGRSVPGVHIRDALDAVATRHPGLLDKFGGHAMAAGLTLRRKDYAIFSAAFDAEVRRHLNDSDLCGVIYSDGELTADEISLELAGILRHAGPWGQAFPEPIFDGVFDLVSRKIVGGHHLKMQLGIPGTDTRLDAIAFQTTDHDWPGSVSQVELAYKLDVNEFRGFQNLQLIIEHLRPQV